MDRSNTKITRRNKQIMKKSIIVTTYNHQIEENLASYQYMVMNKFRGDIPFIAYKYPYVHEQMTHGDMLNKYVHDLFYDMGADCILFIDIDCIPLNKECIETTFELAYGGNLVGNIQRANHYQNNEHVYVGSPYICFTREIYEAAGCPTMRYTHHGDTCEQMTYNCERSGIPVIKFMPVETESPINDDGDYWPLAKGMPQYGIGTTYKYNDQIMNYHLFSSRVHKFNKLFYNKCHEVIMRS